jgi:hypothetical protein
MKRSLFIIFSSLVFALTLFEGKIVAFNYIYDDGDCVIICNCGSMTPPGPAAIPFTTTANCNASCAARNALCTAF